MITVETDGNPPIITGAIYRLGGQAKNGLWIKVLMVSNKYVYTRGLDNVIADLVIPVWKFPGLVADVYKQEE